LYKTPGEKIAQRFIVRFFSLKGLCKMKENQILSSSVKMFVRLLSYHVMCLIVSMSIIAFLTSKTGNFIAQAFDLGIIVILPYLTMWKMGDSDRNQYNFGHIGRDDFKGFKIGFIAYSPFILAALLLLFAKAGVLPSSYLPYYRMIMSPFIPLNQMLMPTTFTLAEQSLGGVIFSALLPLIPPCAVGAGYRFGFERVSFFDTYLPDKFVRKRR
jgi:hypothetical protein